MWDVELALGTKCPSIHVRFKILTFAAALPIPLYCEGRFSGSVGRLLLMLFW